MLTCDVVQRLVGFLLTLYIIDRHGDLWCCSEVGQLRLCNVLSIFDMLWKANCTTHRCTAKSRVIFTCPSWWQGPTLCWCISEAVKLAVSREDLWSLGSNSSGSTCFLLLFRKKKEKLSSLTYNSAHTKSNDCQ